MRNCSEKTNALLIRDNVPGNIQGQQKARTSIGFMGLGGKSCFCS